MKGISLMEGPCLRCVIHFFREIDLVLNAQGVEVVRNSRKRSGRAKTSGEVVGLSAGKFTDRKSVV